MENNNQEFNVTSKQNNSILIILMALIIVALAGYIVYTNFIQKTDNVSPKDNNTEEKEKIVEDIVEEYGEQYKITEKVTYKSKDGKNELVIEPNGDNYYAYFNGKKIGASVRKNGKYLLVEGFEIGQNSQCGEYTYIINSENNELVDLYTKNLLNVVKVNNNYYFEEYICANGDVTIYDEKLNKIGTSYIGSDKKNFYIFDKNIVKYNSNGKVVAKTKDTFDVENNDDSNIMGQKFNDIFYILISDKDNVYFIDTSNLEAIKIGSSNEYAFGGYEAASMHLENGKIVLGLINLKNSNEIINMYYDITSKTLSK